MRVTDKTKYLDFAPFVDLVDESSEAELKKAAEARYGDMWTITIDQFGEYAAGDFSRIGVNTDTDFSFWQKVGIVLHVYKPGMTVLQYYYILRFGDFVGELVKTLDALKVPQDAREKKASERCRQMTFQESILVFVRNYFGLHSFADAGQLTLADFLIAKKDTYNKAVFEKGIVAANKTSKK